MSLPTVSREVINTVLAQWKDPAYKRGALERFKRDNKILADAADIHVGSMGANFGDDASYQTAEMLMLMYLCLENQFEAQELEKQLGWSSSS